MIVSRAVCRASPSVTRTGDTAKSTAVGERSFKSQISTSVPVTAIEESVPLPLATAPVMETDSVRETSTVVKPPGRETADQAVSPATLSSITRMRKVAEAEFSPAGMTIGKRPLRKPPETT